MEWKFPEGVFTMNTKKLAGLSPESVFSYFEEICAIPHGSRNTKMISDYLVETAKKAL
jgi:dipeptidase D